jgi:hypothetical protein
MHELSLEATQTKHREIRVATHRKSVFPPDGHHHSRLDFEKTVQVERCLDTEDGTRMPALDERVAIGTESWVAPNSCPMPDNPAGLLTALQPGAGHPGPIEITRPEETSPSQTPYHPFCTP